jgi:hypothetical protein
LNQSPANKKLEGVSYSIERGKKLPIYVSVTGFIAYDFGTNCVLSNSETIAIVNTITSFLFKYVWMLPRIG